MIVKKMKKSKKRPMNKRKAEKKVKKRRKEIEDTLSWMDILKISEDGIYLARDNKTEVLRGIVINPVNLYLIEDFEVINYILSLSNSLDRLKRPLYFKFIKEEPNLDYQIDRYIEIMETSSDSAVKKLAQMQIDKMEWYIENHSEVKFCIMIKADEEKIDKYFEMLQKEISSSHMINKEMTVSLYESVIKQYFENPTVNEYMFSDLVLPSVDNVKEKERII
ncbi:hypothetical protein [Thomasclavelia saccharogumia]|uniref:hypothetical protein n=1 Tax=Thomasclavelia saccharogumia TaxID=341225 RepID=UPI00047CA551|nr:hypothetical protein [Thomasclavelia saccharogumia]